MNLEEIQKERADVEKRISDLIYWFEGCTGLEVFVLHVRDRKNENRISLAAKLPDSDEPKIQEASA